MIADVDIIRSTPIHRRPIGVAPRRDVVGLAVDDGAAQTNPLINPAAARQLTDVAAVVVIDLVAVVTGLHAVVDDAVAARCRHAGVEAGIGLDLVAVIAGFVTLNETIAAPW